ncbi:transcriptional regulator CynR [Nonomuraea sp. NPDC005983]|uniref:transcriptional regulator CynR n=1 Tax=Nonomuraea sp. NPDC005983 TaxID=3155595 RepID=UPI0033B7BC89
MAALELRHLRYLLAVAEHGNFTRAAEDLHISQPTLSQQIRQLERTLGVQLLDRTGRTVRLTDAGAVYIDHARRALRDLAAAERAVHDVQDLSRGHLRLGATPTFTAYFIGPLTAELHTRHPGISLTLTETTQDRIEAALLTDDLDLGIAFAGPHLPGITPTPLFTETLSLVTATQHAPMTPDPLPIHALEGEQLALLSGDFATRGHIDAYFAGHGLAPRITVEANSLQALTEIVQRTDLATVLPDAITHDHPHLTPVSLDPPLPACTVTLLQRESAYHSAATRAFAELTRDLVHTRGYTPPLSALDGDKGYQSIGRLLEVRITDSPVRVR